MLASAPFSGFHILALKPRHTGTQYQFGFMIVDPMTGRQFCLNLIQQTWHGTIGIDPAPFIGQIVTQLDSTFLVPGEVLVFNAYFGPQHDIQYQKRQTGVLEDYISYGVFVAKTGVATIDSIFMKSPLQNLNMIFELEKVMIQASSLNQVMNQLHTLISVCHELIFTEKNVLALFDGLMHHEASLRNAAIFNHGQRFVARHIVQIELADEKSPLALIINENGSSLNRQVDDNGATLKILRINIAFERTIDQFRIESQATFDHFGSMETPAPSILATFCDV